MDHHPGGLVDHQQELVLVSDREGGALVRRVLGVFAGRLHLDQLAARDRVSLRADPPVHAHPSGIDQPLGARPGPQRFGQQAIEPHPGRRPRGP